MMRKKKKWMEVSKRSEATLNNEMTHAVDLKNKSSLTKLTISNYREQQIAGVIDAFQKK